MRETYSGVTACHGGCFVCWGSEAKWFATNAMALAARHHDATGHATWADQVITVRYGAAIEDGQQVELFAAAGAP